MSAVLPSDVPTRSLAADGRCGARPRAAAADRLRTARGAVAAGAAVLAQGLALSWPDAPGVTAIVASCALALACAGAWTRRGHIRHADVLLATVAFGGLGMLAGEWIARSAGRPPLHHAGMPHAAPHTAQSPLVWVVTTAVMLLACAAACRWSCAPLCNGGWRRRVAAHLSVAAAMIGGMAIGGALLGPVPASLLGVDAAMHVGMVLGMTGGVAGALPLIARLDSRA
ncbi:MAG TPA: hypothetical protein VFJ82_26860 [Longimicrobium sp.]|nr:hypothetical protein [Longimicrobium sp.]